MHGLNLLPLRASRVTPCGLRSSFQTCTPRRPPSPERASYVSVTSASAFASRSGGGTYARVSRRLGGGFPVLWCTSSLRPCCSMRSMLSVSAPSS
eukprot:3475971-Prymnesium_polylepis.1